MVACRYGISLLVFNSKRNSISTRAHVSFSIYHAPPPHTIREKVRQYNHNSSLELPHYIYIYIYIYFHTAFKIQPSKVWIRSCKLCKWTQKLRDKIVSNKTKTVGAKNTSRHYALNIAYCLWILYDLGSAMWFLHSSLWIEFWPNVDE